MKDTIAPIININEPSDTEVFANSPPRYNLTIVEINIDTIWYTINESQLITITTFTGFLNEEAWNSLPNGELTIIFYVNDTAGNLGFDTIIIYKSVTSDNQPFIPGPNLILIMIMMFSSIVYIIWRNKKKLA